MLTILFCICMYRIAELEKRRGWVWAGIQLVISILAQQLFASAYFGAVSGFVGTYLLMAFVISRKPIRKGPFLP